MGSLAPLPLRVAFLLALLALRGPAVRGAEEDPAGTPPHDLRPYGLKRLAYDSRFLFTRPFHLDDDGRARWAAVGGITLGLYAYRDDIRESAQEHRSPGRDAFLDDVRVMGKGGFAPAVALVALAASFVTKNDREKETAQLVLTSVAYSALLAAAGQFVLSTERPYEGDDVRLLRPGGHGVSADAAIAASVVPPLRHQYLRVDRGDRPTVKILKRSASVLLYAGAVLTAYQRINSDAHWAPDAFLGTAVGLGVGETLSAAHGGSRAPRVSLSISPARGGVALMATLPGPGRARAGPSF